MGESIKRHFLSKLNSALRKLGPHCQLSPAWLRLPRRLWRMPVSLQTLCSRLEPQKDQWACCPTCKLDYSLSRFPPWVSLISQGHPGPAFPEARNDEQISVKEAWRQEPPLPSHPKNDLGGFLEEVWAQILGQGNRDERDSGEREGTWSNDCRRVGSVSGVSPSRVLPLYQSFLGRSYLN